MNMVMKAETVTVNAAFLQELKEDNVQLRGLLSRLSAWCVAMPPPRISRRRLASLLACLRDELAMHFSLEDAYGYFDRPATVTPHLAERACRLRAQHSELYEEIARIAEAAEEAWSGWRSRSEDADGQVRQRLVRRCRAFWSRLQRHEAGESELIWATGCCANPAATEVVGGNAV
jgi:hypothetical protein